MDQIPCLYKTITCQKGRKNHLDRFTFPPSKHSILAECLEGRYRPVRITDEPITARNRFIKNASWAVSVWLSLSIIIFFSVSLF